MVWRQQGLGRICAPAKVASGSAERGGERLEPGAPP